MKDQTKEATAAKESKPVIKEKANEKTLTKSSSPKVKPDDNVFTYPIFAIKFQTKPTCGVYSVLKKITCTTSLSY